MAIDRIAFIPKDRVEIRSRPGRGRGVFACEAHRKRSSDRRGAGHHSSRRGLPSARPNRIYDYYFHWDGDPGWVGRGALGLGVLTLCNHSSRPCARVERNHARLTLDLIAITPIGRGEEITIDYNCDLWFEPSPE